MITEKDLDDLKLLKILQESGDLEQYKELKEILKRCIADLIDVAKALQSRSNALMEGVHYINELIGRQEELERNILAILAEERAKKD
jgi:hypothetical protein